MKRGGRRSKNRPRKRSKRGRGAQPVAFKPEAPAPTVEMVVTEGPGAGDTYIFTAPRPADSNGFWGDGSDWGEG